MGKNRLLIKAIRGGKYQLSGYFVGRRIREQSKDLPKLAARKAEMERQVSVLADPRVYRQTWLTEKQLREAEAATLEKSVHAQVKAMAPAKALEHWLQHLETRLRRFPATLAKNRVRVNAFFRQASVANIHEATPEHLEAWILRSGVSERTQLTDGMVLRTFFAYALRMRWVSVSPVQVDLSELAKRAKPTQRPRILTVAQSAALLGASAEMFEGKLMPFVILSTWCFLRKAEVCRTVLADLKLDSNSPRIAVNPRKLGTPSYRVVTIPENAKTMLGVCIKRGTFAPAGPVYFQRSQFEKIKEAAGLVQFGPRANPRARAKVVETVWQENILRHTGISYLYQKTGDLLSVTRQAGNSKDTAFKHYLHLPEDGAGARFYGVKVNSLG